MGQEDIPAANDDEDLAVVMTCDICKEPFDSSGRWTVENGLIVCPECIADEESE